MDEASIAPLPAHTIPGTWKSRLKASGIHLATSATIAAALVTAVIFVWYPSPLFELAKGRDIFFLLLGCDIILGPVMTLIIFNVRKPKAELIRDVSIIACVQLGALGYGVATLLEVRPAYIAYNVGQFNVPLVSEMVAGEAEVPGYPVNPWWGPKLVGTALPKDREENNQLTFSAVTGRGDVFQMPKYFVPYESVKPEVCARARSAEQFARELQRNKADVEALAAKYASKGVPVGLLPLRVRTTVAAAVVNRDTGDFLGIEPLPLF